MSINLIWSFDCGLHDLIRIWITRFGFFNLSLSADCWGNWVIVTCVQSAQTPPIFSALGRACGSQQLRGDSEFMSTGADTLLEEDEENWKYHSFSPISTNGDGLLSPIPRSNFTFTFCLHSNFSFLIFVGASANIIIVSLASEANFLVFEFQEFKIFFVFFLFYEFSFISNLKYNKLYI